MPQDDSLQFSVAHKYDERTMIDDKRPTNKHIPLACHPELAKDLTLVVQLNKVAFPPSARSFVPQDDMLGCY